MSLVRFRPEAPYADLAHLVERHLAKVEVAGSSPVIRSKLWVRKISYPQLIWRHSQVVRHGSAKPLSPGSNPGDASKTKAPSRVLFSFWRRHSHFASRPRANGGCLCEIDIAVLLCYAQPGKMAAYEKKNNNHGFVFFAYMVLRTIYCVIATRALAQEP